MSSGDIKKQLVNPRLTITGAHTQQITESEQSELYNKKKKKALHYFSKNFYRKICYRQMAVLTFSSIILHRNSFYIRLLKMTTS